MTKPNLHRHRVGHGDTSLRLDPYALDECTITLEEWHRLRDRPVERPAAVGRRVPQKHRAAA